MACAAAAISKHHSMCQEITKFSKVGQVIADTFWAGRRALGSAL
jgi:hypothetical protein